MCNVTPSSNRSGLLRSGLLRSGLLRSGLLLVMAAALVGACGGSGGFRLSSGDNNPEKLSQALAIMDAHAAAGPINRLGKPLVFLAARGKPKQLIAFDLEAKQELWRVPAQVSSRVVVGRDFVAHKEGESTLVGRDISTGKKLWSVALDGTFVGAAADAERVIYTVKRADRTWVLRGLSGTTGKELWESESTGVLGAPAASGGLVFSPFMKQWLTILDAGTGKPITRVRGIDEEISFVRTTPSHVYFGSKAGVFLLDQRAASGKRSQSTYGRAPLPAHFKRAQYYWDAFDPVQAGYSVYDRNRVLWNGEAKGETLGFVGDTVAVQAYRFFFGFSATSGTLLWAYNHPRVDVVASAQLGTTIGMASMLGEIGALDSATGEVIYKAKVPGQFSGGTFDAAGWAPNDRSQSRSSTAAALASIAQDRDARFNDVKKFAVTALSQLTGGDVTRDLLALIQNPKTPPYLVQTAADVLVSRKDPAGLSFLIEALIPQVDYVAGVKPRSVGITARAISEIDASKVAPEVRKQAVNALVAQLGEPTTKASDLVYLVRALGRMGSSEERASLRSFLLMYRAEPAFAKTFESLSAAVDILLASGMAEDREAVVFVAENASSLSALANYARVALVSQRGGGGGSDAAPARKSTVESKSGPQEVRAKIVSRSAEFAK